MIFQIDKAILIWIQENIRHESLDGIWRFIYKLGAIVVAKEDIIIECIEKVFTRNKNKGIDDKN